MSDRSENGFAENTGKFPDFTFVVQDMPMDRNADWKPDPVDITACKGLECPDRENCARFVAIKDGWNEWQTFFTGCPYDPKTRTCRYFRKIS